MSHNQNFDNEQRLLVQRTRTRTTIIVVVVEQEQRSLLVKIKISVESIPFGTICCRVAFCSFCTYYTGMIVISSEKSRKFMNAIISLEK